MNQTLTKSDIVDAIQKIAALRSGEAKQAVEIMIEIVKRTLEAGQDVRISGFGKFCVKDKRSRRGRNPANGETLTLDPRRVVTFKCSGKLRGLINAKA